MAESMESRIFTRAGAYKISKSGGLAVSAYIYERERERERERVAKLLEWPRKSVILFTAFALFNSLWGMVEVYSVFVSFTLSKSK